MNRTSLEESNSRLVGRGEDEFRPSLRVENCTVKRDSRGVVSSTHPAVVYSCSEVSTGLKGSDLAVSAFTSFDSAPGFPFYWIQGSAQQRVILPLSLPH